MPLPFKFAVAVLACYRLSQLVVLDDGPYKVFERFRSELGRRAAGGDAFWENMAELLHCPFCMGVWFALPLAVWVGGGVIEVVIIWLGIAGGQAFMQGVNYDA